MPGTRCAVFGCKNTYKKREENGENFIFHRFPKGNDRISQRSREEWIIRCKRPLKFNPDTRYICSVHFTANDYERDLQNELLGLPLRTILKKTAIPTLHLYKKQSAQELHTARSEQLLGRNRRQKVTKLLEQATFPTTCDSNTPEESSKQKSEPSITPEPDLPHEIPDYKAMYIEQLNKNEDLERKYHLLKSGCHRRIKSLYNQFRYFKVKCHQLQKFTKV